MPTSEELQRAAESAAAPGPSGRRARATGRGWNGTDLALIWVFAALTAASIAVPPIPAGNLLGVPITLQTMVVTLAGLVLGGTRGFAAIGLYVLLGLVGLPILSGYHGGLGVLAAPSAGYLLSFPFAAALAGLLASVIVRRSRRLTALWLFLAAAAATVLTHAAGIAGMMVNGQLPLPTAALADLPFIPGDLVKNAVAAAIAVSLHKAFPDLLRRR
jgi:biotin transport system substrate-specific component